MIIDIHNHFMPRGIYAAARKGRDWYGASLEENDHGEQVMVVNGKSWPLMPELNISASPEDRIMVSKKTENIDMQALSLRGSLFNFHFDPQTGSTYCREINQELADLQKAYPANYAGLALLPWQDTKAALVELEFCTKNLGLRAICTSTSINGQNLDNPAFLPIFQAIASEGLFLFCHASFPVNKIGRMSRYAFSNSIGLPLETTVAMMSLIFGGVMDKCPGLKICFSQGGGYSIYGIGRLANAYHKKPEANTMLQPPEKYLSHFYYDCITHNADSLRFLIDHVSAEHVLLGTDFPLGDGISVSKIVDLPFLSEESKHKILGGNASRLLGVGQSVSESKNILSH